MAGTCRNPAAAVSLISLITGLTTFGTLRSAVSRAGPIRATPQASAAMDATSAIAMAGGLSRIRPRWTRLLR